MIKLLTAFMQQRFNLPFTGQSVLLFNGRAASVLNKWNVDTEINVILKTGKKHAASTFQRTRSAKARWSGEMSPLLDALLRDVGRPPRDAEGEVHVEGMWRLFLAHGRRTPSLFSPLPCLFPEEMKESEGGGGGQRKINHQLFVWSLNKMDWK